MTPVDRVRELVERWWKDALDAVPPEYAARNLLMKYLNCDNAAAGMHDCADELAALLPLLEQQEARMGEYERALHPGPMTEWPFVTAQSPGMFERGPDGRWVLRDCFAHSRITVRSDWAERANAYEQATGLKVDATGKVNAQGEGG